MQQYKGISVCGGAAVGKISVFKRKSIDFSKKAESPKIELARLAGAKQNAAAQLKIICENARDTVGTENSEIFEIQIMLLDDEELTDFLDEQIKKGNSAEQAVAAASDLFSARFADMDDDYMSARAADVRDVCGRLLECLGSASGVSSGSECGDGVVVCAVDLSPSETISLDKSKVVAIVTARGSENSHTAILARSMGIPAVIGVGGDFPDNIKDGASAAVDGCGGIISIEPTSDELNRCMTLAENDNQKKEHLKSLVGLPNVTRSGRTIDIYANIGSVEEAKAALENDTGGIGLFRSEFLYLENDDFPNEQSQFSNYKKVLEMMGNRHVVIRTVDIGADKHADYWKISEEQNPALGVRGIRACFDKTEVLETQLRALYRASVYGKLGIMFPMITSVWEVEQAIGLCKKVKRQLQDEKIPFSENVEIGVMIETPAAAIISDLLAAMVDFFSVGTNDLTQYTLACDRQNENAGKFFDPHHEAVLRLIKIAADNAHRFQKWIGVCGELAADTEFTEKLLECGVDELSVPPKKILEIRDVVRMIK